MKLYLDASALTKAYLIESESADVLRAVAANEHIATGAVAYAELRAAFARAIRGERINTTTFEAAKVSLDARWSGYIVVEVDPLVLREAARIVEQHPQHALRALDAIHLASALRIATGDPTSVTFACWDLRLWRAARDEGFTMLPPAEPA